MPNYDSDSSSDGGNEYNTTNVILGYATTEVVGDDISHVGGHSTWLDNDSRPPLSFAKCKVCGGYLSLLLQLNADLQQFFPYDQRRLHVLCCQKKTCTRKIGSVRAFREVRKPQRSKSMTHKPGSAATISTESAKPKIDLGSALFGGKTQDATSSPNPFSLSHTRVNPNTTNPFASIASAATSSQPVDSAIEPPVSAFADKLQISSPTKTSPEQSKDLWPSDDEVFPAFSSFFLDACPEELEPDQPSHNPGTNGESSKSQYELDDTTMGNTNSEKDNFESSLDKTFQKFSDRIAQNPEQVLRYEFKGQPLLYSGSDEVASRFVVPFGKTGAIRGLPKCEQCGAQRVFELQLVPGLIYELEKDEVMDLEDGMEWGTIIVGTCVNNCGEQGTISFREEWVGVQWEERMVKK